MLLKMHFLWIFALSVQGHSGSDHENGEFTVVCLLYLLNFLFVLCNMESMFNLC